MEPYYETPLGKLYHGDCLEIMGELEPVDLVLTDIPYGKVNRDDNGLRNLNKGKADDITFNINGILPSIVKVGSGCFYIFCGTEQVSGIRLEMVLEKLSTRLGFWEKTNPSPMNGEHIWLSGIECFVYGKKPGATHNVKCKNPVFRGPIARNQVHETQKPLWLFADIILASSNEYQTVLDFCIGSGTTAVACERLNRKWIGIEIEEKYCEIAAKRIEQERKQRKLF